MTDHKLFTTAGWDRDLTDPDIYQFVRRENAMADLRRHWRALGFWAALRASLACIIGQHMIGRGMILLAPHSSRETVQNFERTCTCIEIDVDIAREGREEARELAIKKYERLRDGKH